MFPKENVSKRGMKAGSTSTTGTKEGDESLEYGRVGDSFLFSCGVGSERGEYGRVAYFHRKVKGSSPGKGKKSNCWNEKGKNHSNLQQA